MRGDARDEAVALRVEAPKRVVQTVDDGHLVKNCPLAHLIANNSEKKAAVGVRLVPLADADDVVRELNGEPRPSGLVDKPRQEELIDRR